MAAAAPIKVRLIFRRASSLRSLNLVVSDQHYIEVFEHPSSRALGKTHTIIGLEPVRALVLMPLGGGLGTF